MPAKLFHDGKNRAVPRLLRPQKNPNPNMGYYSPASIRSATFTHFIAGPLAGILEFLHTDKVILCSNQH
jgi:hypothetical protein